MPVAGRILRGPDAPAAQHPLVREARRGVLQPGRRPGTIATEGPSAGRDRRRLRSVASATRPIEPRAERTAVSAGPAATNADLAASLRSIGAARIVRQQVENQSGFRLVLRSGREVDVLELAAGADRDVEAANAGAEEPVRARIADVVPACRKAIAVAGRLELQLVREDR